jgi:ribosomal protein S18 acetylase RimI-like enzyme
MLPEYRGKRLAVQLVGQAASVFRTMGRKSLRFHVADSNMRAIEFYSITDLSRSAWKRGY